MGIKSVFYASILLLVTQADLIAAEQPATVKLYVLGIAQDAGYPQLNCYQPHCERGWRQPAARRGATSLALVNEANDTRYLIEATPDIKTQLYLLHGLSPGPLTGVFLTHGHMGHYTGLMHFGREAAATIALPVYVMPRMSTFLRTNGPWSQLVRLNNISLVNLSANTPRALDDQVSITPMLVPHRDEFTETVGYRIKGPNKTALFIPDIDKWSAWDLSIVALVDAVDYALIDASFFKDGELPNRNMAEVPHPFVVETMHLFEDLAAIQRDKIIFIHFNHTNPLLNRQSEAFRLVTNAGYRVAEPGMMLSL